MCDLIMSVCTASLYMLVVTYRCGEAAVWMIIVLSSCVQDDRTEFTEILELIICLLIM